MGFSVIRAIWYYLIELRGARYELRGACCEVRVTCYEVRVTCFVCESSSHGEVLFRASNITKGYGLELLNCELKNRVITDYQLTFERNFWFISCNPKHATRNP